MFISDNLGIMLFAVIIAFVGFLVWMGMYIQKSNKELRSAVKGMGYAILIGGGGTLFYYFVGGFWLMDGKQTSPFMKFLYSNWLWIFIGGFILFIFILGAVGESKKKKSTAPVKNEIPTNVKNNNIANNTGSGFWSGHEGLAVTFWGYFVAGNIIGNLLIFFGTSMGVLIFYLAVLAVIIWNVLAVMGVFNAANIYTVEKVKKGQTYGYATAAKIASVILILSAIGNSIPK